MEPKMNSRKEILFTVFPAGMFGIHDFLCRKWISGSLHLILIAFSVFLPSVLISDWGLALAGFLIINFVWAFYEIYHQYYKKPSSTVVSFCWWTLAIDLLIIVAWLLLPLLIKDGWMAMWLSFYLMPIPIISAAFAIKIIQELKKRSS